MKLKNLFRFQKCWMCGKRMKRGQKTIMFAGVAENGKQGKITKTHLKCSLAYTMAHPMHFGGELYISRIEPEKCKKKEGGLNEVM